MNSEQIDGNGVNTIEAGREWLGKQLAVTDKHARWFLTEHPILALACAVGIGYLAARLLGPTR